MTGRERPWGTSLFVGALFLLTASGAVGGAERRFDVTDYGAVPDGVTPCTAAIQRAVDRCSGEGGGSVYFGAGVWLSGTIYLESRVTLLLDAGAVLRGSRNREDYGWPRTPHDAKGDAEPFSLTALIAGQNLEQVAIRGLGTIDGSGDAYREKQAGRPKGIYLVNCRDVLVENVRLRNSGSWMQHYRLCQGVAIRGVRVFNHAAHNNDGLNIDSCRDVRISDCTIDADDDAIVLKSLSDQPCRNVTIANCVVSSHCNAIKMGTESGGGFQNIAIANCAIQSPQYSQVINGRQRGLAGIALEIVDGGLLDQVAVTNIVIRGVTTPIFLRLGDRARPYVDGAPRPDVGAFRNVVLSNILAEGVSEIGCSITGLPGHPIENVSLSNLRLQFEGGVETPPGLDTPEKRENYPESTMFGVLPSYGFYCRHVEGLTFRNVQLRTASPDRRPAIVCDDVGNLELSGFDADSAAGGDAPLVWLRNSRGAWVHGCRITGETPTFLRVDGDRSSDVSLMNNDLHRVRRLVDLADDAAPDAVHAAGHRTP